MKTIDQDILITALASALETMAFIAVEPGGAAPAGAALQISLAFSGVVSGELTLIAPAALGMIIAANLAATEPELVSPEHAVDALRELANVTVGLLLRQLCSAAEMPLMAIPVVSSAGPGIAPDICQADVSADGQPVIIALRAGT